jgi:chromosome segregation ATPase
MNTSMNIVPTQNLDADLPQTPTLNAMDSVAYFSKLPRVVIPSEISDKISNLEFDLEVLLDNQPIQNPDDSDSCMELLKEITAVSDDLENTRKSVTAPILGYKKSIDDVFKAEIATADRIKDLAKSRLSEWQNKVKKENAEIARKKAEAEAELAKQQAEKQAAIDKAYAEQQAAISKKQAEEQAEAEAKIEKAKATGNTEAEAEAQAELKKAEGEAAAKKQMAAREAQRAQQQLTLTSLAQEQQVIIPELIQTQKGVKTVVKWTAKVLDDDKALDAIISGAASNPMLKSLLKIDNSSLQKMVKLMEGKLVLDGVLVESETSHSFSKK